MQGDRMTAWRITRTQLGRYIRSAGWRPPGFYQVVYPLDFDPTILELSRDNGVDPYFIFGLICQESHYAEQIVSAAGAIGLMQLMPATARSQARKLGIGFSTDRLYAGEYNLKLGIAHVASLWQEFAGDSLLVLAGYNAGKSAAQMWYEEFGDRDRDVFVEQIPYRETRLFVKRIIEHIAAYRRLYPDLINEDRSGDRAESPRPH
jgi:soluble lytic murein transglycosylase